METRALSFLPSEYVDEIVRGVCKPAFFLRIASPTPVRCWTGVGRRTVPEDAVEDDDTAPYIGLRVTQIPMIEAIVNGQAQRTVFTLNGVSSAVVAMTEADSAGVRNSVANFGVRFYGSDEQPIGAVWWVRQGIADLVPITRTPMQRTVGVSIGWGYTQRRRPQLSFFTKQDQQRRSPDDLFCNRTPAYQNKTRKWPLWQ